MVFAFRIAVLALTVSACSLQSSKQNEVVYAPAGAGDIFTCVPEKQYCHYSYLYIDKETCTELLCRILFSEELEVQRVGDYERLVCDDSDNCQRVIVNAANEIVAFYREDVKGWWFSVSERRIALQ